VDRRGDSSAGVVAMLRSGREKNPCFISGKGKRVICSLQQLDRICSPLSHIFRNFVLGVKRTELEALSIAKVINA
jgi:hypothetical protein